MTESKISELPEEIQQHVRDLIAEDVGVPSLGLEPFNHDDWTLKSIAWSRYAKAMSDFELRNEVHKIALSAFGLMANGRTPELINQLIFRFCPILMLTLPVKAKWFDQIRSGEKTEEYRLVTDHWKKRLDGKQFDYVEITRGYPSKHDYENRLKFNWNGHPQKTVEVSEWDEPKLVYAIDLSEPAL